MGKRLLKDARRALEEDLAPVTSDYWMGRRRKVLAEAEADAKQRADKYIKEQEQKVRQARDAALRTLTEVRDELQALTSQGSLGRLSAGEYTSRLSELAARQRQAEESLANAAQEVDRIAAVEQDPIAWADSLAERFPNTRKEFPW